MTFAPDGQATHGDGSQDRPGIDTNGDGLPNDSRMFIAKEAVRDILLDSNLDIEFGLMRYHQEEGLNIRDEGPTGPRYRQPINYDGTGSCDPNTGGADVLVPVGAGNRSQILQWMDNTESFPTNKELRGSHWTPLGLSLRDARTHMSSTVIPGDPQRGCRSYYVIMITDGNPECSPAEAAGSWVTQAQNLRNTTSGGQSYDIKTFVVGFGQSVNGSEQLNLIARAGGTALDEHDVVDLVAGQAQFVMTGEQLLSRLRFILSNVVNCSGN